MRRREKENGERAELQRSSRTAAVLHRSVTKPVNIDSQIKLILARAQSMFVTLARLGWQMIMGLVEAIKGLLVTYSKYKMKTSSPQLISLVLSILFTFNTACKKQGSLETWNKKPHPFLASGTEKLMEKQKHFLSADGAKRVRQSCSFECCFPHSARGQSGKCPVHVFL